MIFVVLQTFLRLLTAEENKRVLSVLQSNTTPSMKKRQIMQMVFGDYRQKMTDDHKAQEDTGMENAIFLVKFEISNTLLS